MLSIVPIFAIAFAIARNFGFEDRLHEVINKNMQGQEEIMKWVTDMVDSLLVKTKGGILAGIGWSYPLLVCDPGIEQHRSFLQ